MEPQPTLGVIGAGTMGHGIAQVGIANGFRVVMCDQSDELLARGHAAIRAGLERSVAKGKMSAFDRDAAMSRLIVTTRVADAAAEADLVIESAPEKLDVKQEIFRAIERSAPAGAVLATNTSSLSVSKIALDSKNPSVVVGMHFFNPPPLMELVEIVRGDKTSDWTVAAARAFAERMGKTVIVVRDTPGFATSRLGVCLGAEAMRMLEQGVASAEDIDRAMELGYRHPMGPLRLTDVVGLDVRLAVLEHLHAQLGEAFRPPEILRKKVAEGKLGKKSGEGFYKWNK